MPLFTPPAPPDLQQTTSLPSMPLCGASPTAGGRCEASPPPTPADVSAPPPGLIAPLSPRLAEEEEEQEEEEGSFKHDINESFRGNRRSTITAEKKKKQRKSQRSDMFGEKSRVQPARIASTARRQRKMDDDDESQPDQRQDVIQLEERSSITETPSKANSKTGRGETRQHRGRSDIKAGRPAERIQRTRAEGGGNKTEEEDGQERRCKEEQKDELMGTEEQAGRPRRKAVGPPIRYLLESEEQSHGPSAANHSKAKEVKVKRRLRKEHHGEERRGWAEPTERTVSSRVESSEGGGGQLCQLFARLEARRCLKDIEPRLFPEDGGPDHGEVVQLYGTEGTGKTELLYHLLCRCVLPVASGGLEVDVVFVDTDYSLDMLRLVSILDSRLNTACSTSSPSAGSDEVVLRSCLSRLLVVHCSSSSQLLLTLHFLETSLSSRPGLALLLIDSISAFYWLDRCEGGASVAKQEEKLSKCAELLGRLLRDYRITVFATCHAIRRSFSGPSSSSSSSSECDRPYLCRPWQRLVTHRLLCSRQEAANNMAAAAGGSKEQRRRQVFTVHCTSSSSRTKAYRSSSFYVTDGGVEFI